MLPLMEKRYVTKSAALSKYAAAQPAKPHISTEANTVELNEMMQDTQLERVVNMVDVEEAHYAGEEGLLDILTLQKMCQEHNV